MNNDKKIKVLLCINGNKDSNKPLLDRAGALLRYALDSEGIEYTYDYKENYDLVHLISLNQFKAYRSVRTNNKITKTAPVVLSLFNNCLDLRVDLDNQEEDYMDEIMKVFKPLEADVITCPWASQKLILSHTDCFNTIKVINIGAKTYHRNEYSDVELSAFRRYYKVPSDSKIIVTLGEYNYSKGFAELEAVARIMPEYEFFFFGGKSGVLSNSSHYGRINDIPNLHYEGHIPYELYHSAIFSADAAFFPYRFHVESTFVLELMKAGVPIVSNDNPFLRDLIIGDKTAIIGRSVEEFYAALKTIDKKNCAEEAKKFVEPFTPQKTGRQLRSLYQGLLLTQK